MKLSELKNHLENTNELMFRLPSGEAVPNHFHVTEVGVINKQFIDCGGTLRSEQVINFQLWTSIDYDHRIAPEKLKSIIGLSEKHLNLTDGDIEVEYQGETTIQKFGLEVFENELHLTSKMTDCLAKDNCGIPASKPKVRLSDLQKEVAGCTPGSGCC